MNTSCFFKNWITLFSGAPLKIISILYLGYWNVLQKPCGISQSSNIPHHKFTNAPLSKRRAHIHMTFINTNETEKVWQNREKVAKKRADMRISLRYTWTWTYWERVSNSMDCVHIFCTLSHPTVSARMWMCECVYIACTLRRLINNLIL